MGAILKQRSFFLTKQFELTNHSIKVKLSTFFSLVEEEINFEDITYRTSRRKLPNFFLAVPSFIFFVCTVLTIYSHFFATKGSGIDDITVYAVLLVIFAGLTIFTYENEIRIMLVNGKYIAFYPNSPNETNVLDFIETLKSDQKAYLLKSYAKSDPYLSAEQLSNNLRWLWDRKIINDEELKELRTNILPNFNGGSSVGFTFNPGNN